MYTGKTLSLSSPRVEGTKISRLTVYILRGLAIYKVHLKFLVLISKSVGGRMSGHYTLKKDPGDCFFQDIEWLCC